MKHKHRQKRKQKWISVQDSLPGAHQEDVLVLRAFRFLGELTQAVAYHTGSHWMESNSATVLNDVTHWRHKPKPPKKR